MEEPVSCVFRWRGVAVAAALLGVASAYMACAEERRPNGSTCASAAQCTSGLCYHSTCLDPAANEDDDTLLNRQEHAAGTNPFLTDSDGDLIDDGVEVGDDPFHPIDTDGDNDPTLNLMHDALESNRLDSDCDCISDQLDHASEPRATDALVASIRCRSAGVCQGDGAVVTAVCPLSEEQIPVGEADNEDLEPGCSVYPEQDLCFYDGVSAYESEETLCDGLDNDCDGDVDEVLYLGSLRLGDSCEGQGACAAATEGQHGVVECGASDGPLAGMALCSRDQGGSDFPANGLTNEGAAGSSICDQVDNDCDGAIDEDSPGWLAPGGALGQEVAFGEACDPPGPCGIGFVECNADGVLMCSTQLGGTEAVDVDEESCNTLDDDCDGVVDEGFTWNSHAVGETCADPLACPSSMVVCSGGEAVCHNTAFSPPLTVTETMEKCDGVDNDCDGAVDEEDGLKLGCPDTGVCEGQEASGALCQLVPGEGGEPELLLVCSFVDVVGYEVGSELSCNGQDDDCDGDLDEGLATPGGEPLGEPCQGVGTCEGMQGVTVCGDDGAVVCKVAAEATVETCNGLDDDCDGLADEEPLVVPGDLDCKNVGVCSALESPAACVAGDWVCAYDLEPGLAGYEDKELSCDGLDNDCDGVADEGTGKQFVTGAASVVSVQPPHRRRWVVVSPQTGQALLMGGLYTMAQEELDSGAALGDAWLYDHATASWKLLEGEGAPPSARYGHAMAALPEAGLVVVHGGYEYGVTGFQITKGLYVYDLAANTWHEVNQNAAPGLPLPLRVGHTLTPVPGAEDGWKLVLHGGKMAEDSGFTTHVGTLQADTETDGYALTWEQVLPGEGSIPEGCRMDHAAGWDANSERLVVIGGTDCGNDGLHKPTVGLSLTDPPEWSTLVAEGEAPVDGLVGATVVVDDETLYVVGTTPGAVDADGQMEALGLGAGETHAWGLDLAGNTWTKLATSWPVAVEQVRWPAVWLDEGNLRVAGGSNADGTGSWRFTWSYDVSEGTWSPGVPWAGPPPRVGGTLVVRWETGDTWLLGGSRASGGAPLQDAWSMNQEPGSWATVEPPVPLDESATLKTQPALEGAAGSWDPVHQSLLLYGGNKGGEAASDLWAFVVEGEQAGFKEITAQGDLPPAMSRPSLALAPGGNAVWLVGIPSEDDVDDDPAPPVLYELSLGSYTWSHLSTWADGEMDQDVLEIVANVWGEGLKLLARTSDDKVRLVRLDGAEEEGGDWVWTQIGESSPQYSAILGAALDPGGAESLALVRGGDGAVKVLLANHETGDVLVQPGISGWSWPEGVAMASHPTLGAISFGGADSLDITWGMAGVFAQTCP